MSELIEFLKNKAFKNTLLTLQKESRSASNMVNNTEKEGRYRILNDGGQEKVLSGTSCRNAGRSKGSYEQPENDKKEKSEDLNERKDNEQIKMIEKAERGTE